MLHHTSNRPGREAGSYLRHIPLLPFRHCTPGPHSWSPGQIMSKFQRALLCSLLLGPTPTHPGTHPVTHLPSPVPAPPLCCWQRVSLNIQPLNGKLYGVSSLLPGTNSHPIKRPFVIFSLHTSVLAQRPGCVVVKDTDSGARPLESSSTICKLYNPRLPNFAGLSFFIS